MTFTFGDLSYNGESTNFANTDTSAFTSDLDQQNINKLNTKRTVGDYDSTDEAAKAASETAANNQSARDKSTLSNTLNEKARYDDRNSAAKQFSDRVASAIKTTDPDKSADRTLTASENDKNRYNQSNESAQKTSADRANSIDDNASAKSIAKINAQTNRETQRASTERAKIAAEAQVSAAILGKQHNYGGYS